MIVACAGALVNALRALELNGVNDVNESQRRFTIICATPKVCKTSLVVIEYRCAVRRKPPAAEHEANHIAMSVAE